MREKGKRRDKKRSARMSPKHLDIGPGFVGLVLVFVVMDTPYMVYPVRKGCIRLISPNWVYPFVAIKEIHHIGCIRRWAVQIRLVLLVQLQFLNVVSIEMENAVAGIGCPTSVLRGRGTQPIIGPWAPVRSENISGL
ncbi:hypothetical protein DFH07DRAFT_944054 [Mycena maculata]|uniref:Uncharacterized protein n=1 Tax=Mycena maculata TaxID=230809 RepID=A0AAD7IA73_9AGAR|nr:hypothetical protein DFH07DRAFT_944054 [Mycena maculata]